MSLVYKGKGVCHEAAFIKSRLNIIMAPGILTPIPIGLCGFVYMMHIDIMFE